MNATDVIDVVNMTTTTAAGGVVPHYIGLKFGEDGVREPPSFTASNNVIIMVLGLSLLIVPVVGFLVCMCAKSRVLKNFRDMKFTSSNGGGTDSGLPYSHFDSEPEDYETTTKVKKVNKPENPQNKDVRVLINNDNTVVGSPIKKIGSSNNTEALLRGKQSAQSSTFRDGVLNDDCATLDVDATFIMPSNANPDTYNGTQPNSSHSYT